MFQGPGEALLRLLNVLRVVALRPGPVHLELVRLVARGQTLPAELLLVVRRETQRQVDPRPVCA
eukprot:13777678-Alexandrium_andersonii.AAC.1